MAKWIRVTANYDHRWPSLAVTALQAGTTVYVKDEVADAAIAVGAAEETEKPEGAEERAEAGYAPTPSRYESARPVTGDGGKVLVGGHGFDKSGNPVTRAATPVTVETNPAATPHGDRSESPEETAADNEATAAAERAEAEARGRKGK